MAKKLTKNELKTLKNTLGKQGITIEQHEDAKKSEKPMEILQIDCFSLDINNQEADSNGWHVGYGVHYNGVGISAAEGAPESSASSESGGSSAENRETEEDESSGFDSDPPTDDEDEQPVGELFNFESRRESDDVSDKGQLLYGLDDQFYVDKRLTAKSVTLFDEAIMQTFKTGELKTTNRFEVAKSHDTDDESHQGYQMIGDGSIPCATSHSEESEEDELEASEDITTSSGLWCNFVISPAGLEDVGRCEKLEIPEEKLKTIPLDSDKLAQISAAMANFKLPTPPGWEGVSDSKILEFIRQRV